MDGVKNILDDIFLPSKVAESLSSDGDLSDRGYSPTREEKIVDPRTGSRVRIVKADIEYDKRIENKSVCSICEASQKGTFFKKLKIFSDQFSYLSFYRFVL